MLARHLLALSAALVLITGCRGGETNEVAMNNGAETGMNEAAAGNAVSAPAAAEFAAAVAASDMYEIESGKLAAEKASSADLKSFANMLVQDHQKSTADLKAAAASLSPPVTLAPALDGEKQAMLDALNAASAADFDKTFIDQQKQAHQKALELLRQYETGGSDQALREFAAKAAGVVQNHLDRLNAM